MLLQPLQTAKALIFLFQRRQEKQGSITRSGKPTATVLGMRFAAGLGCEECRVCSVPGLWAQTLLYSLRNVQFTHQVFVLETRHPKLQLNKDFMPPLCCWEYFPMHVSKNIWLLRSLTVSISAFRYSFKTSHILIQSIFLFEAIS